MVIFRAQRYRLALAWNYKSIYQLAMHCRKERLTVGPTKDVLAYLNAELILLDLDKRVFGVSDS